MEKTPKALLENHRRFLSFLRKRLGSIEEAEDLLQAAYLKGLGKAGTLKRDEDVVAWFYRILRNALVDHYRRRAAEGRAKVRFASGLEEAKPDPELKGAVCRCVEGLVPELKPEYAEAIRGVDLGGLDVPRFAKKAKTTANNAAVRLHRARAALKKKVLATCGSCAAHGCEDCSCRRKV